MIDVWKLFNEEFKNGDYVMAIHDDTTTESGSLISGKLTIERERCLIGGKEIDWDDVIFIAHDGFPCRTFKINMTDEQLGDIENQDLIILMRKLLTKKPEEIIITKRPRSTPQTHYGCGGGCPFVFEEVQMQIINPFVPMNFFDYEETLLMQSKDGAVGMFWDIENEIFDFAAA